MCGIVGIVNKKKLSTINKADLEKMSSLLTSRGPDNEGFYINNNVGLAHRSLSVIDIEGGNQPIFNADKSVVVVLNGKIYNYINLQQILYETGYSFLTESDAEVLVQGYQAWGIDGLLEKIEGPFTFAIYDIKKDIMYLARDRFGERPVYYYSNGETLYFASELKAFEHHITEKSISKEALNLFLSLSYIPSPYTIYKDVHKLHSGHYMAIEKGEISSNKQYYFFEKNVNSKDGVSFEEAKRKLDELLRESIKQKMAEDLPVGAFLSGGLDSSIVVGIMSQISETPINTFSIGFEEKSYDESQRAQIVVDKFKTNHTIHYLNYDDVVDIIDNIIDYFDEPYGDSSAIPSFYVAKLASSKVKVVLTGDCADELFGGYEKYLANYYAKKWNAIPLLIRKFFAKIISLIPHTSQTSRILRHVKKVMLNSSMTGFDLHYSYMCLGFSDDEKSKLLNECYLFDSKNIIKNRYEKLKTFDELNHEMRLDLDIVLEGDMFPKGDRCGMMNSLEERVPFIDFRIVHFASSLPSNFKINGKKKKYILKETYKKLLPQKTLQFKKSGFSVPVDLWLKNQLKEDFLNLLSEDVIVRQGIFQFEYINNMIYEHFKGKENHKGKLWNIYVFQKWYYKHFDKK